LSAITKLGVSAYSIALAIIAADQAIKYWILYVFNLPMRLSVPVAGPFSLTMVMNRGVSFGLFRADQDIMRWALVVFSLVVATVLTVWARRADRPLLAVALGMIIGGAIGNAIDRIRFGAVVDFLDFSRMMFPWVFNVADAGITIGVALLLLDSFRSEQAGKVSR
jgi:signal peptidase II